MVSKRGDKRLSSTQFIERFTPNPQICLLRDLFRLTGGVAPAPRA